MRSGDTGQILNRNLPYSPTHLQVSPSLVQVDSFFVYIIFFLRRGILYSHESNKIRAQGEHTVEGLETIPTCVLFAFDLIFIWEGRCLELNC